MATTIPMGAAASAPAAKQSHALVIGARFLPTTAFAMVAATGDIYYGLWYPVAVAVVTLVAGILFLPEARHRSLID